MLIQRAYRYELDPNNIQRSYLAQHSGVARFAYNWGLARWNEQCRAGLKPSWMSLSVELNSIKREEFPWMAEVTKWAPGKALGDLGDAFKHFFRRVKNGEKPGYPRFKKRGHGGSFYSAGADLRFRERSVRVPRLGWVRMAEAVRFPGRVVSARFTCRAGKWFMSAQIEVDDSWVYPHQCENQAAVGVDLGLKHLSVLSDGQKTPGPKALRFYENRLKRLQRELARRDKGGANWNKTKVKIQKTHEKIADIRRDAIHKLTTGLVRNHRFIGIEDLNVKGMVKNHRLAKSLSDAAFGEFRRQLEYKAVLAGCTVVIADRWFPSSKRCSACGHVLEKLLLSQRQWKCPECSAEHDRDINAAINLKQLAAGYAVKVCGAGSAGDIPSGVVKLPSLKQKSSNSILNIRLGCQND